MGNQLSSSSLCHRHTIKEDDLEDFREASVFRANVALQSLSYSLSEEMCDYKNNPDLYLQERRLSNDETEEDKKSSIFTQLCRDLSRKLILYEGKKWIVNALNINKDIILDGGSGTIDQLPIDLIIGVRMIITEIPITFRMYMGNFFWGEYVASKESSVIYFYSTILYAYFSHFKHMNIKIVIKSSIPILTSISFRLIGATLQEKDRKKLICKMMLR